MTEAYTYIANAPADRFYVSDVRASVVVSDMMQGKKLGAMRPLKREMFEEICKRVIELKKEKPLWSMRQLCAEVVKQPAPKFYITPGSAKIMVCKARKDWVRNKLKRLSHFPILQLQHTAISN